MTKETCLQCPNKMCVDADGGRVWTDLRTMSYFVLQQPVANCGLRTVEKTKPLSHRKRRKEHFRDL